MYLKTAVQSPYSTQFLVGLWSVTGPLIPNKSHPRSGSVANINAKIQGTFYSWHITDDEQTTY